MPKLTGRRIVLTGASRGVGYETVKLFSAEGAEIIGVARDAAKLNALASEYAGFQGFAGDITDKNLGAAHAKLLEFVEELPQCELQIDLATQQMTLPDGSRVQFPIDEFSKTCLLQGVDQLGYILNYSERITAYEATLAA